MADLPDDRASDHAHSYWREPVRVSDLLGEADAAALDGEFARFAEFLPTLCWIARGDGYIVWYNKRWHDYCGTRPEQMEGWGWQIVHDPELLPPVMERWTNSIAAGRPFEMVFPLRGADGIFRPFLTRIVPVRDASGGIVRWFGVNTEVGAQIRAEQALQDSEARFDVLTDAMPQMVWSTLPDGYHDYYNAQWYAFTGAPAGATDGEGWNDMFHPDDRARAWALWRHCLATGEPYEIEYRLRHYSGDYRWVLGRALPVRSPDGEITRWIGTCTDIDEAKRAAERNELLSRELSHRIKNIFAVISGLVNLTGRRSAELKPVMNELLGRIAALGRAHEFARPHSPQSAPELGETTLHGLLAELLKPYADAGSERVAIRGVNAIVDDKGATPIALVVHELATNSAKYGALSVNEGGVIVDIAEDGERLELVWTEQGGPPVTGAPDHVGFGTQLAELSVARQLGGELRKEWRREGLKVKIRVKSSRLRRDP
ncbi:sensor histidine kinase [Sphingomonas sp. ID1715]|uniref:sensor histidine kinase n=1 Tax=Sphingomonas sp. ID1715 TaxID=1656898 RepID=UPI001487FF32|nr:PAS domain-containing protein [Sphingomonas sp. ID1715]